MVDEVAVNEATVNKVSAVVDVITDDATIDDDITVGDVKKGVTSALSEDTKSLL